MNYRVCVVALATVLAVQAAAGMPRNSHDQQDQQPPKPIIPSQRRVTEQLIKNWAPFKTLRQHYAGTRLEEQQQLHLPQKHNHKATVADSKLRVEMNGLEEQADNSCPYRQELDIDGAGTVWGSCFFSSFWDRIWAEEDR